MLLEVLRKIWVWIHVRKIVRLWDVHLALTPSQHGFRRGHGTDSALVIHLNCIEHARYTNTPRYTNIQQEHPPGVRLSVQGSRGSQLVSFGCPPDDFTLACESR